MCALCISNGKEKNYKIVHNDETLRISQWKDILYRYEAIKREKTEENKNVIFVLLFAVSRFFLCWIAYISLTVSCLLCIYSLLLSIIKFDI